MADATDNALIRHGGDARRIKYGTTSEDFIDPDSQFATAGDPVNQPSHYPKQARYQDQAGDDWIDEFARTATPEEFRGAMRFTIGKYNRRAGKKDELVAEIRKMHDYCGRWLAYEEAK